MRVLPRGILNFAPTGRSNACLGCCFAVLIGLSSPAIFAADENVKKQADAASSAASSPSDTAGHKAQKRDVDAVVVLLFLTVVVIVLSFAGLLIWGRRVRRLARAPLKNVPLPDSLWYLRQRAATPNGAGSGTQSTDHPPHAADEDDRDG
ncbi:MAG: hypothetical protein ACKVT0_16475 [Planctomycetaceae bacterium]